MIVLETLGGRMDARSVADKVIASVAKPVTLQRHTVKTTVSIGISFYPDNSGDAEALVRAADSRDVPREGRRQEQLAGLSQGTPRTGEAFPADTGSDQLLDRRRFLIASRGSRSWRDLRPMEVRLSAATLASKEAT